MSQTLYDVLDVTTDARPQTIRQSYRMLRQLYEDPMGTYGLLAPDDARRLVQEIEHAYEILGDAEQRRAYDHQLQALGYQGPWFEPRAAEGAEGQTPPPVAEEEPLPPAPEVDENTVFDGAFLAAMRASRGYGYQQVSRALKITETQLKNIENHRFEHLPAAVYLKGFLKSYARYLKIDQERLIVDYMRIYNDTEERGA